MALTPSDRIVLIEPNPGNVQTLRECWHEFKTAEVMPVAVLPSGRVSNEITLWYAMEDAPYFQIASNDRSHVERHYPQGTIREMSVPAISIDELIRRIGGGLSLEFLGIDVEGLDSEILLSMDWETYNFNAVSF
jgi:FkbM family methyltransferase